MWLPPFCRLIVGGSDLVGADMDEWMVSICDFFLLRVKGMGYLEDRVIYQRDTGCDFPVVPPPTNSDLFRRLF